MSYSVTKPLFIDLGCDVAQDETTMTGLLKLWHFRWTSRRALAALDDDRLADIGVSRGDAMQEARKPFWQA